MHPSRAISCSSLIGSKVDKLDNADRRLHPMIGAPLLRWQVVQVVELSGPVPDLLLQQRFLQTHTLKTHTASLYKQQIICSTRLHQTSCLDRGRGRHTSARAGTSLSTGFRVAFVPWRSTPEYHGYRKVLAPSPKESATPSLI